MVFTRGSSATATAGRIGAHTSHARHDSREITSAARRAFLDTFEQQADPDGILPLEERARRASHLRKAHFLKLAYLSAKVRAARRQNGGQSK